MPFLKVKVTFNWSNIYSIGSELANLSRDIQHLKEDLINLSNSHEMSNFISLKVTSSVAPTENRLITSGIRIIANKMTN